MTPIKQFEMRLATTSQTLPGILKNETRLLSCSIAAVVGNGSEMKRKVKLGRDPGQASSSSSVVSDARANYLWVRIAKVKPCLFETQRKYKYNSLQDIDYVFSTLSSTLFIQKKTFQTE